MKLLAFLRKDFLIAISYRFAVVLRFASMLVSLLMLYYIGETFEDAEAISPHLQRYGGSYFSFVLVGIAVSSFVTVGLNSLSREVRSAQVEGTLEALLSTPPRNDMLVPCTEGVEPSSEEVLDKAISRRISREQASLREVAVIRSHDVARVSHQIHRRQEGRRRWLVGLDEPRAIEPPEVPDRRDVHVGNHPVDRPE